VVDQARVLWQTCAELLTTQVSEAVWQTSFRSVRPIELSSDTLTLAVPSSVVKERIESRYLELVKGAVADAGSPDVEVLLVVRTDDAEDESTRILTLEAEAHPRAYDLLGESDDDEVDEEPPTPRTDRGRRAVRDGVNPVNPRYTFEAFVTGTSNRFAHAAALSVAETPAKSYNPLFIYGDAGLGKTHLLHAIAHYVGENYPNYVTRYVSTETFMNQFVDAIRTNTPAEFKRRYREIDVLLVDDIQFMEGKEGLQEEFFHTFNSLHGANRQIVLSSDRPPDAISTLEDRLRSRFKMGLITDIQPPDLETRLAILRKKAESETTPVPDDVLEFIASHITDNIRELEGALIRVSAYASLTGEQLSVELAERVLSDILADSQPRPITPDVILRATSDMFGFSIEEICGKSRRRPLVTARQVGMYVFRELTDLSYPAIAREFGGRDHTTVIHAVEKIGALMKERRQIYDQVTELSETVRGGSAPPNPT
jgi:chromosomal replication initiator protein